MAKTLKNGSTGSDVKKLQTYLYNLGYLSSSSEIDGIFGSKTLSAVKAYQKASGLTVDGIVGTNTWSSLSSSGVSGTSAKSSSINNNTDTSSSGSSKNSSGSSKNGGQEYSSISKLISAAQNAQEGWTGERSGVIYTLKNGILSASNGYNYDLQGKLITSTNQNTTPTTSETITNPIISENKIPTISSSLLSYGSKGDDVKTLQQFLVSQGYLTGSNAVDGIYGAKTRDAVKAFQTASGLTTDGIVGSKTKSAITNTITNTKTNTKNNTQTQNNVVKDTASNTVNAFDDETVNTNNSSSVNNNTNSNINSENTNNTNNTSISTSSDNFYGQERNAGAEQDALTITKYMAEDMEDSDIISSSFLKSLTSDYKQLAFYVNALTYGGYTIGDVINDIERNYMISKGNKNASNIKIIDASLTKAEATQKGSISSESDILSLIPESIMNGLNIDTEILSYGSENIPDELFNELVPLLDNTSDEYKDAVEDLMATYSDLANTQLEAETEQQKAVADYNMKIFKDQLKEKYHLALSDNADEAWAQIEGLLDNYNTRNLSGSGIEQESIDEQLKKTREEDRRSRVDKLNIEEAQMAEYYQKYATADEIAELIAEDNKNGITKREDLRAYKWGLIPSSNIIEEYSLESLAEKYPDLTNEELQNKRNAILDENNNYRSTIYKNYYSGILTNEETQRETAEDTVIKDAAIKEKNAYEDYDKNTAFLGQTATGSDQYTKDNSLSKSAEAANNSRTTKTTDSTNKTTDSTVQSNTATTGTTTPTKKSYTTLYDYYTANGGYNTWNSAQRKADASKAKITNYTGTAEQNKLLLDHLNNN
jgi:peptidoglycan hydrolase-like protein with peptidoglycan-binding domain